MNDVHGISVNYRVKLIVGMIMAGLGVKDKIAPLDIADLRSENADELNDGTRFVTHITAFLNSRNLPSEKIKTIIDELRPVFIGAKLWESQNSESRLKMVYANVLDDIMPFFSSKKYHLDFTGKLFNVLNAWVSIPDGAKNDVVLTPRYVTDLMARLAMVNKDSYVWDYAVGTAGFLISSMKLMLKDAEDKIKSADELETKKLKIKGEQLLGVELRSDIYVLAVLNMILMEDGSSNIIHKNSLTQFMGNYEQGKHKDEPFPANVFLLNPPYSAPGKGFIFVEKALSKMKNGRAAVLIQENAGSGNGLPYTKNILANNTLVASIHMSDIFCGKAGVQTAIYVFETGTPHNENSIVKFIDFSNDGYTRQNKKKSSANVNLKNTNDAPGRYAELVDIVLNRKKKTQYFDDFLIEDTISLNGDDWIYSQHKKIDTKPTEGDFRKTVADYLSWKVSTIIKNEDNANF